MKDALEVLRTRRTVREYDTSQGIDKEVWETIIDCGRLACTARNDQPWEFVVITDSKTRQQIADLTEHGKHIADAAACVAVFCTRTDYYVEDGAAATQNMLNAAWALGVAGCWVDGDKKDYAPAVAKMLGAPEDKKLFSLVALGRPAAIPETEKRPLNEVLHWEKF
ncbi:MAG: nitroreductase family protein [Candidatus Hydrogenedentes bacterium]|nr:nitroreductase family protein [Candidatus Hydrogenedentota bacterium]